MNLNFQYLRAFAEVARCGSFTQAAEHLHLTQPAISKAVRELENHLEMTLLERTSRHVSLTEAGFALYEHARSIFALELAALEDIKARRALQRGRLVVGASTTIAAYWLPAYLTRFLALYPGMEVSLVSGNTEKIARDVLDCRVDVALVEGSVEDARLECTPWHNEPLTLVAPTGHAISEAALRQQCWIVRESGSGTAQVTEDFLRQQGILPRRRVVVGSNTAAVQMVLTGAGVCLVPRIMVQAHIARGALQEVALPSGPLTRPLNWINLRGRPASLARRAIEALLNADDDSR